jgi:hypothetical protein
MTHVMAHVATYCERHLHEADGMDNMVLAVKTAIARVLDGPDTATPAAPPRPMANILARVDSEPWFTSALQAHLTPSQQAALDTLLQAPSGMFVLTGGPGAGKTFMTQCLAA